MTKTFYLPLVLTVTGDALYPISQKSIPSAVNPFFALTLAYLADIVVCAGCWLFLPTQESSLSSVREANWVVFGVGLGAVAIELGYLLAYRIGWKVSLAAITSNLAVTLLLIPVGIIAFRERLSLWNAVGIVFCVAGLILVSKTS
jgi:uncharacterized membrane protein